MKYIYFNDVHTLKKAMKIIMIYWLILILSYFLLSNLNFDITNVERYIFLLGLDLKLDNIAAINFNILNILIYLIIALKLFTKDITFGNTNLFLRMNLVKWLILKIGIIFLTITFIKSTSHILVGLLCHIAPLYLLSDILFTVLFIILIIVTLLIFQNSISVALLTIMYFYLCYYYELSTIKVAINHYYITLGIILGICFALLCHKGVLKLFKEETNENRG